MSSTTTMSRRSLIGAAGAAVAGAAAFGAAASAQAEGSTGQPLWTPEVPEQWDRECQLLVLGCGAAGACAVVEAYDLGLDVIGVQKEPDVIHSNCTNSGGWVCGVGTSWQRKEGIEDSVDLFVEDVARDGGDFGDPDVIRAWGEISGETIDWLYDLGCEVIDRTYDAHVVAGSDSHSIARDYCTEPAGNGIGWMTGLQGAIDERGIDMMYSTAATKLYRDESGRVVGALVTDSEGSETAIKATGGVLVSTGGMGSNVDVWGRYNPTMALRMKQAENLFFCGPSSCTADGIIMLENVGAWMWPTKAQYAVGNITDADMVLEDGRTMGILFFVMQDSPILVNKYAQRYFDETSFSTYLTEKPYQYQEGMAATLIFDDETRLSEDGQIYLQGNIDASPYLGRPDLLAQADTIAELATQLGLDPDALQATVDSFNEHAASGEADEFGRERFLHPIATPPFWGIKLGMTVATSKGGAKINPSGQVIDRNNEVIPGLYAAGEDAFFSGHGDAREHVVGGCNSMAMCYGRIVARHVAEELGL